ncbi:hypothetical protein [Sorangium sp. So ce887]|uniref:hypothetical protein n=1 Tax=Sorangium sp. So ce887 TaxID=3133324 RepID=UPI003F629F52
MTPSMSPSASFPPSTGSASQIRGSTCSTRTATAWMISSTGSTKRRSSASRGGARADELTRLDEERHRWWLRRDEGGEFGADVPTRLIAWCVGAARAVDLDGRRPRTAARSPVQLPQLGRDRPGRRRRHGGASRNIPEPALLVHLSMGDTFQPAVAVGNPGPPHVMDGWVFSQLGDFNGDGLADTVQRQGRRLRVLLQRDGQADVVVKVWDHRGGARARGGG